MFYSSDILSRRRHGFGLYWLAATLGGTRSTASGTSTLRKLSRKEILGCKIVTACEKLMRPDEPLALRLTSNLLCGIARVFQHQYNIYHTDVSNVHSALKKAFSDVFAPGTSRNKGTESIDLVETHTANAATSDIPSTSVAVAKHHGAIDLPKDRGLEVLGWDRDFDLAVDFDLSALDSDNRVNGLLEPGHKDADNVSLFGSAFSRQGTPMSFGSPQLGRPKPAGSHQASDLAAITLREPLVDEYMMRSDPSLQYRVDDDDAGHVAADMIEFGENEAGLLEGQSPELDAVLRARPSTVNSRAGSGVSSRAQYRAAGFAFDGPASSSAAGAYEGADFGGFEMPDMYDGEGFNFQAVESLDMDAPHQEQGPEGRVAQELEPQEADRNQSQRTSSEESVHLVVPKPQMPKKLKTLTWDTEIALTDDQIRESRRTYQKRMLEQRVQAQSQTAAKQSAKKALEMVFASPTGYGPGLAEFWSENVTKALPRLGAGLAAADRKKRKAGPATGHDQATKRAKGSNEQQARTRTEDGIDANEMGRSAEMPEWDPLDHGGWDGYYYDDYPQEVGRALSPGQTGSQAREAFPWNNELPSSEFGGYGGYVPPVSSQGGTARVSLDTPLKFGQHRSRTASLVPSALGSGAREGSLGVGDLVDVDQPFEGFGDQLFVSEPGASVKPDRDSVTQEQESLKFLSFATRKALSQPESDLLFSDVVPVAATAPRVAASAFYHTLVLVTRGHVKVEQDEAYGEIRLVITSLAGASLT